MKSKLKNNLKRLNKKAWFSIHKQGPYTEWSSSDAIGFFKKKAIPQS
jgi:hypothetical protein